MTAGADRAQLAKALVAVLSLLLAACQSVPAPAPPADTLLVRNVTIIPMDRPGYLAAQDVLIREGRVAAIQPTAGWPLHRNIPTVDGTGKFMMPALWDMHAHVSVEESLKGVQTAALVPSRLARFLGYGIVGVRDTGSTLADLRAMRQAVEATDFPLPRLLASGPLLDGPPTPWTAGVTRPLNSAAEARAAATEIADAGADLLKSYETISRDQFLAVAEVARARSLPITGHISFHLGVEEATAAGLNGIEHVYVSMIKDCLPAGSKPAETVLRAWVDDGYGGRYREMVRLFGERDRVQCKRLFHRLAERGVFVTPVLSMELKGGEWTRAEELAALPAAARATCLKGKAPIDEAPAVLKREAEQAMMEVVRELHAAGVPLLAGPDAPGECIAFGHGLHRELQLLTVAGLTPFEALRTATVNPAAYRGSPDEGVIKPGAPADLLLLDSNPLEDVSSTLRISGLIRRGLWFDREALAKLQIAE